MRIKNLPSIESMNGSQDALVIEQTDGSEDKSRKVSPAQIKQYVLGNSIDDIYSVMGQMGAKNLIPYPFYETTKTQNGITFTDNGDGTITVSGTASADATFDIRNIWSARDIVELLPNTIYAFSGCPVGGSSSTYLIQFVNEESNLSNKSWLEDIGTGGTLTTTDVKRFVGSRIVIKSGAAFSTPVTFKPMLRLASDTDNTYQPYAKTNRQLTDELSGKQDTLSFDNVPTQNSNNPVKSGGIKSSIDDKAKRLNNIKIIDENFEIRFVGFSDVANRILCPIVFPFAFASNDYTLECSLIDLASVGRFTTGITVNAKDRSSALIILSATTRAGATYCGAASIHISRTE